MIEATMAGLMLAVTGPIRLPAPPVAEAVVSSEPLFSVKKPLRSQLGRYVAKAAAAPRGWERFRVCVVQRESHGNPRALNPSGAAGRYQFMPNWRHGGPYIVRERLVRFGLPAVQARAVRLYLTGLGRIERYPAIYQDVMNAEVIHDGGWRHWDGGSGCNSLVPANG